MPGDNSIEYDIAPDVGVIRPRVREAIDGKFHDVQHMNEVGGFVELANTDAKTVVPAYVGRRFLLRTVVITNKEQTDVSYTLSDGTNSMDLTVKAGETLVLNGFKGVIFSGTITAQASSATNGSKVVLGGELRATI